MLKWNLGWVKGITKPMESLENWTNGDLSALRKQVMQIFRWFNFLNFLLVQFSLSPILVPFQHLKHLCGDLSALKNPEMQIFHWFSFLNFPLVQLSPWPILGSVSTFKTFMRGHLCVVNESPMCSFTLLDIFIYFDDNTDLKRTLHCLTYKQKMPLKFQNKTNTTNFRKMFCSV